MAIQVTAGEALRSFITATEPDNTPSLGLVFETVLTRRPDGTSFLVTVTERGNGVYEMQGTTLASDPSGEWFALVRDTVGGRQFQETWDVSGTAPIYPPAYPEISVQQGMTRREIRASVAGMLSDYYTTTLTVGGQTNAITDPVAFARESSYFKGMQVLFSSPASIHAGHVATVTQSDGLLRTLYFEPPLASSALIGDVVELFNFRGRGTTISQYNAAINDAISAARQQHALLPYSEAIPGVFSRTAPEFSIPPAFVSISGVETPRREGGLYRLKPSEYRVDRMARTIEIWGEASKQRVQGRSLTVRGYVMPALLNDDDDRTSIDVEWLFNEVKAQLLERMVASGMPVSGQDRLFLQERTEAAGKRTLIVNRAVPNTIRLS